ncbi:N-acetylmuramidase domain-containing protein [Fulvivirgaceae bacterium BMA10]|uniref:N-acetylmuramidase domain-containing protein n=1 Tax=Splendidivirga corallicola TaxID=3051826 RepID=A0ABT8KQM6_9BACT|nr:N-acetylmuramidase domain-containing protein [Fulvivirgaceae bacterium BMA10]
MKVKITASKLNVRRRPSLQSNRVGFLYRNNMVNVLNQEGRWYEINFNSMAAYIHSNFAVIVDEPVVKGTVTANLLNVRGGTSTNAAILGQLRKGTEVVILSKEGDWLKIKFDEGFAFVFGKYIKIISDVDSGLKPDNLLPVTGTAIEKKVARTWNKFGGLLEDLGEDLEIEAGSAIAVLCVESSGKGFDPNNQNRMIIRFENHIFWSQWGKQHEDQFNEHFAFNKTRKWTGHKWRKSASDPWITMHKNQAGEWDVLEFAMSLSKDAALSSISMGIAQIMGFNYKQTGYDSVEGMFDRFSSHISYQIRGMFEFFTTPMIQALKSKDFVTFAGHYNGQGKKQDYGNKILEHYNAFQRLSN